MTEQPDDAPPRVVKKVVKKTVARPLPPRAVPTTSTTGAAERTTVRQPTARLTTPTRAQATRTAEPTSAPTTAPSITTAGPPPTISRIPRTNDGPTEQAEVAAPARKRFRPSLPSVTLPSLPKPDVRGRAADLRHGVGDRVHDAADAVRDRMSDAWHWLIGLRLPHLSPVKGSAITGVIVGLLSVAMGYGFYQLFEYVRGTQAGGGWGFLALVFVAFVAFITGELLLSGFGVPLSRVVSIMSVLLVLLAVLIFFIRIAAGMWAWLLIPTLFALAFVASSAIMQVAAREENSQRLPWEPTDESQVRR